MRVVFFLFMRKIVIEAILGISFCAMGVVAFAGALYLESTTSTASTWHGDGMKAEGTQCMVDFPTCWGSYLRGKCSYTDIPYIECLGCPPKMEDWKTKILV